MNCLNTKCSNEVTRDYGFCHACEPTCHLTDPRRDCLCDSCREKRASEYPELNLMAWEGDWYGVQRTQTVDISGLNDLPEFAAVDADFHVINGIDPDYEAYQAARESMICDLAA